VKSLAVIGHNPSMCQVLAQLTGGSDLDLRKGAFALIEITDPKMPAGRLMWLAPPTLFGPR
jgi:phosphohistidine phosphatase SixA